MKYTPLFLVVLFSFCSSIEKKTTLDLQILKREEFNARQFEIPQEQVPALMKRAHDSCMGFTFDANALYMRTRDSFSIGNIVNKRSLKTVNTIADLSVTLPELISHFNIISRPCYEKRVFDVPLQSLLGKDFNLQFPNATSTVNKEINDAVASSGNSEMQTGSWVYLDMKDVLIRILDTAQSKNALAYKANLLDTSNMVLAAAESITDVSFTINTTTSMSKALQAFLHTKPLLSGPNSQASVQLFYLEPNQFQMNFFGLFPVVGQFMKAQLKAL